MLIKKPLPDKQWEKVPAWLYEIPVAHRGWHNPERDENAEKAFLKALEVKVAIELDIQLADDEIVVFHDKTTKRVCQEDVLVKNMTSKKRKELRTINSNDSILTLEEALELINGRVPVIVELKDPGYKLGRYELVNRASRKIEKYEKEGLVAVHSFDTRILRLIAKRAPDLIRGQVAGDVDLQALQRANKESYISAPFTKPSFVAHNVQKLPSLRVNNLRSSGIPALAWTVRTEEDLETAIKHADNVIAEGESLEAVLNARGFQNLKEAKKSFFKKVMLKTCTKKY